MQKIKRWKDKTKGEKIRSIISYICFFILLAGTVLIVVFYDKVHGANSVFNQAISTNEFVNLMYSRIPSLLWTIQIIIWCIAADYILKFTIGLFVPKTQKGLTMMMIFRSFLKWAIAIMAVLFILATWGVDTLTLLASAGVLTLIIGLGAQSLIADIVAGLFIVFEDEYEVGDIIVLDGWRGTVIEIGIRTTKIQDAGGNIKIVNNSEIKAVINQTKENSTAKCYLNINYEEDLDKVEEVINKGLKDASKQFDNIIGDIKYLGVSEFSASGVTLFFIAKCKEADIYTIQRKMNKVLQQMLAKGGILLAYQNIVVHNKKD